ncbi:hypothetical protein DH2020_010933 [Rehmannia glutinosa]|uniref:IBH1-like N-terminal domain-containing protein n=1 Tax=Rehmannia glutinosa TaxID=99300 RepID=A0ABR0XBZ3_REHGL
MAIKEGLIRARSGGMGLLWYIRTLYWRCKQSVRQRPKLSCSMKTRMCNSAMVKQEFLKKWIKGLHIYNNLNKCVTISDRKKAIKLSADVAIASTRKAATHWSKALMDDVVSRGGTNKILVEEILGGGQNAEKNNSGLITCSNRILRRSHNNIMACRKAKKRVVPRCVKSSSIARKLVKNKTRVLKSLVPGGQKMDGNCLIKETLDYIVSLRVQVDVMRRLANAAERFDP